MSDELVHLEIAGAVATITLDSPHNRNALSRRLVTELTEHLATAAANPDVRAVVLAHTGSTFCSGADLSEASQGGGGGDASTRLLALLRDIAAAPVPVVARLQGHVRAGGIGIVGACDVAVAANAVTFAFTEVRIGVTPAIISLTTLPRMPSRQAAQHYLTGSTFDARAAQEAGLVSMAVDEDALDAAVSQVVEAFAKGSPQGLRETKALLNRTLLESLDARGQEMAALSARLFATPEAQERILAFLSRRR